MNLESLRRNKVMMAVGVVVLLAVVTGAYLAFADGTVEISNAEELQQVRENPDGNYILVDDIDLSHIDNFEPIEDFTGSLNGNGNKISNLTIDRPETDGVVGLFLSVRDDTRLFGIIGDKGTVKNVRLEDANVTGRRLVGSLAGVNKGTVTRVFTTGQVSGDEVVGGLVGQNQGTVRESRALNHVSGSSISGGLIGWNYGEVTESYSKSNVSGRRAVGGLVGTNNAVPHDGAVTKSYATGDISGEEYVGGLIGKNKVGGRVSESHATGEVTGSDQLGGLVGANLGEVSESYYCDASATQQNSSTSGVGLTTEEMTGSAARENMKGFDFEDTWQTVTNPDGYPRLAWQNATREDGGSAEAGSEDGTVTESEPEDSTATETEPEDITTTDWVSVSGLIFKNRTVRSLEWYYLENRTDRTDPEEDAFTLRGVDGDGDVISSQSFDAPFRAYVSPSEESPIETNVTGYSLVEEYPLDLSKFRLVENGTTIAEFNPNVELLRTAAESIPQDGFKRQDAAERQRENLLNEIDALENMLEAGNREGALRKIEDDILPSLEEWLEDGYETEYVTQMTKDEVLKTAEAVTERLRTQAGD